jgi:hypothetical protein
VVWGYGLVTGICTLAIFVVCAQCRSYIPLKQFLALKLCCYLFARYEKTGQDYIRASWLGLSWSRAICLARHLGTDVYSYDNWRRHTGCKWPRCRPLVLPPGRGPVWVGASPGKVRLCWWQTGEWFATGWFDQGSLASWCERSNCSKDQTTFVLVPSILASSA